MKNEEFAAAIGKIYMFACACVALLTACSGSDATPSDGPATPHELQPATVSFSTEVNGGDTRATTGLITTVEDLKKMGEGFGVFAYLTDGQTFNGKFGFSESPVFSESSKYAGFSDFFMQNQQVTWGVLHADDEDNRTYDWVYSPLKYWPNATGNATPRYISFFAYAPHVAEAGGEAGVVNFTRSDDRSPHVIYKLADATSQVDLLWGNAKMPRATVRDLSR